MNQNGKEQKVIIEEREILFKIFLGSLNYSELVKLWKSVQCRKQKVAMLH